MLSAELESRIRALIGGSPVVLFMKGTRAQPRCGFSAAVVDILEELQVEFRDVDVLVDPEMREGIKLFSSWPTLPQLYVRGELVGGADIVRDMHAKGELHEKLGVKLELLAPPAVIVTDAAAVALAAAAARAELPCLRIEIDAGFRHKLYFDAKKAMDLEVAAAGQRLVFDPGSARRAAGLRLDYVEGASGRAFKLDNPNAAAKRACS